jgi:4-hydroxy-tetrahydrodipicolinate synthase
MDVVGLPSSRCRPPTRDDRDLYHNKASDMLIRIGAPRVKR